MAFGSLSQTDFGKKINLDTQIIPQQKLRCFHVILQWHKRVSQKNLNPVFLTPRCLC